MVNRRRFLAGLGSLAVGSGALMQSGAFSEVSADRGVSVDVASGSDALLGIVGRGPVQKNKRDPMVEFTNNLNNPIDITVTLDNCNDGALYDNEGPGACFVELKLKPGNTGTVNIEASTNGTITYGVSANAPGFSLTTPRSVEAQSGRGKGPVKIQKPGKNDFTASDQGNSNVFEVKKVDIRDEDGDNDLENIQFEVVEDGSSDTVVGYREVTNPPGDKYRPKRKPALEISPDSGYTIKQNTTYELEITAFDADGNTASETVEDTT